MIKEDNNYKDVIQLGKIYLEEELKEIKNRFINFKRGEVLNVIDTLGYETIKGYYPFVNYVKESDKISMDLISFWKLTLIDEIKNRYSHKELNILLKELSWFSENDLFNFEKAIYLSLYHNEFLYLTITKREISEELKEKEKEQKEVDSFYFDLRYYNQSNIKELSMEPGISLVVPLSNIFSYYNIAFRKYYNDVRISEYSHMRGERERQKKLKQKEINSIKCSNEEIYHRKTKKMLELELGILSLDEIEFKEMLLDIEEVLNNGWIKAINIEKNKNNYIVKEELQGAPNDYKVLEDYVGDFGEITKKKHGGRTTTVEGKKTRKYNI